MASPNKKKEEREMTVTLFMLNEDVEVNENEIVSIRVNGDVYDEAYQLPDGRWIADDEAVAAWVMLGYDPTGEIEVIEE